MLPASLTVILLIGALVIAFGWFHVRISKVEEVSDENARWIVNQERENRKASNP